MTKTIENHTKLEKDLNKKYKSLIKQIAAYLDFKPLKPKYYIKLQDESSIEKIPSKGISFGSIIDEENNRIILANWIEKLPIREKEILQEYLIIKQIFHDFILNKLEVDCSSNDFLLLISFLMATIFIMEKENKPSSHQQIINIRKFNSFEDNEYFRSIDWDVYITRCNQLNISAVRIFDKAIKIINNSVNEKKSYKETIAEFDSWINKIISKKESSLLPIFMDDREYQVVKALHQLGQRKATAKKIGEIVGLSHNTINNALVDYFEKFGLFWHVRHKFTAFNLYPYFFRITLSDKKHYSLLLKNLKQQNYMMDFFQNQTNDVLVGVLFCPHVVQANLDEYFLKLQKKGIISHYIFRQLRKQKRFCTITQKEIKATVDNYKKLLTKPSNFAFETLLILDEETDITKIPKRKRKLAIDDNLLTYFSIYGARNLRRVDYMFYPLEELFDLCKRNDINPEDSRKLNDFVNQLELRLYRLGLIDYFLNIENIGTYSNALYFELTIDPNDSKVNTLVEKFKIFSALVYFEFLDRVIFGFPNISMNHPAKVIVEEEFKKLKIEYLIYWIRTVKGFKRYIPLNRLYDYENESWKI
jgi:hypothetical protein